MFKKSRCHGCTVAPANFACACGCGLRFCSQQCALLGWNRRKAAHHPDYIRMLAEEPLPVGMEHVGVGIDCEKGLKYQKNVYALAKRVGRIVAETDHARLFGEDVAPLLAGIPVYALAKEDLEKHEMKLWRPWTTLATPEALVLLLEDAIPERLRVRDFEHIPDHILKRAAEKMVECKKYWALPEAERAAIRAERRKARRKAPPGLQASEPPSVEPPSPPEPPPPAKIPRTGPAPEWHEEEEAEPEPPVLVPIVFSPPPPPRAALADLAPTDFWVALYTRMNTVPHFAPRWQQEAKRWITARIDTENAIMPRVVDAPAAERLVHDVIRRQLAPLVHSSHYADNFSLDLAASDKTSAVVFEIALTDVTNKLAAALAELVAGGRATLPKFPLPVPAPDSPELRLPAGYFKPRACGGYNIKFRDWLTATARAPGHRMSPDEQVARLGPDFARFAVYRVDEDEIPAQYKQVGGRPWSTWITPIGLVVRGDVGATPTTRPPAGRADECERCMNGFHHRAIPAVPVQIAMNTGFRRGSSEQRVVETVRVLDTEDRDEAAEILATAADKALFVVYSLLETSDAPETLPWKVERARQLVADRGAALFGRLCEIPPRSLLESVDAAPGGDVTIKMRTTDDAAGIFWLLDEPLVFVAMLGLVATVVADESAAVATTLVLLGRALELQGFLPDEFAAIDRSALALRLYNVRALPVIYAAIRKYGEPDASTRPMRAIPAGVPLAKFVPEARPQWEALAAEPYSALGYSELLDAQATNPLLGRPNVDSELATRWSLELAAFRKRFLGLVTSIVSIPGGKGAFLRLEADLRSLFARAADPAVYEGYGAPLDTATAEQLEAALDRIAGEFDVAFDALQRHFHALRRGTAVRDPDFADVVVTDPLEKRDLDADERVAVSQWTQRLHAWKMKFERLIPPIARRRDPEAMLTWLRNQAQRALAPASDPAFYQKHGVDLSRPKLGSLRTAIGAFEAAAAEIYERAAKRASAFAETAPPPEAPREDAAATLKRILTELGLAVEAAEGEEEAEATAAKYVDDVLLGVAPDTSLVRLFRWYDKFLGVHGAVEEAIMWEQREQGEPTKTVVKEFVHADPVRGTETRIVWEDEEKFREDPATKTATPHGEKYRARKEEIVRFQRVALLSGRLITVGKLAESLLSTLRQLTTALLEYLQTDELRDALEEIRGEARLKEEEARAEELEVEEGEEDIEKSDTEEKAAPAREEAAGESPIDDYSDVLVDLLLKVFVAWHGAYDAVRLDDPAHLLYTGTYRPLGLRAGVYPPALIKLLWLTTQIRRATPFVQKHAKIIFAELDLAAAEGTTVATGPGSARWRAELVRGALRTLHRQMRVHKKIPLEELDVLTVIANVRTCIAAIYLAAGLIDDTDDYVDEDTKRPVGLDVLTDDHDNTGALALAAVGVTLDVLMDLETRLLPNPELAATLWSQPPEGVTVGHRHMSYPSPMCGVCRRVRSRFVCKKCGLYVCSRLCVRGVV